MTESHRPSSDVDEVTVPASQTAVRIAPMLAIAWIRTYSVVLPGIMATFAMSPSEGGRFVLTVEGGSFFSLFFLGMVIERLGASRVLLLGLPTMAVSLVLITVVRNEFVLFPIQVLLGTGMAWTATAINTLMAQMGRRRGLYLGMMHATFSLCAAIAPIIAAVVIDQGSWQVWFQCVAVLTLCLAGLVYVFDFIPQRKQDAAIRELKSAAKANRTESPAVNLDAIRASQPVTMIGMICMGVFFFAAVQGALNSWTFLYVQTYYPIRWELMFDINLDLAAMGPTCLWVGILVGRLSCIALSQMASPKVLLIGACCLPATAIACERLVQSPAVALAAMFVSGVGVSGIFQLGTQWAAEMLPDRIGTASTAVMAFAWLGIGSGPYISGLLIKRSSWATLSYVVIVGSIVAMLAFSIARSKPITRR